MNIIAAIKEALVVKREVANIQAAPKINFFSPAHFIVLITALANIYQGSVGLLPPQISMWVGVGLAVVWLLYNAFMHLHHQTIAAVQGVPELDVDGVLKAIEAKYPNLSKYEADIKAAVDIAKNPEKLIDPAAPAAPAV